MAAAAIAKVHPQTTPAAAPLKLATAPVTQAELQAVIDSFNRFELLAVNIRRRLESGAGMERGALGVSTLGLESLEDELRSAGRETGVSGLGGLDIEPVEDLAYQLDLPHRGYQWFVLV
jgi:hypothetical protein